MSTYLFFCPVFYHKAHPLIVNFDFFQRLIIVVISAGLKLKVVGNDRPVNISVGIKINIRIRGVDDADPLALGLDVEVLRGLACGI